MSTTTQSDLKAIYEVVVEKLSYKSLEAISDNKFLQDGIPAYIQTAAALVELAKSYDIDSTLVEALDYKRLAREGKYYLYDMYDNEEVAELETKINLASLKQELQDFLTFVRPVMRQPSLEDIDAMLDGGRIVSVTIANQDGRKAILITAKDHTGEYKTQNPYQSRETPTYNPEELQQAIDSDQNMAQIVGYKLRVAGLRLDQFVIREKPTLSRSYAVRLIGEERVLVNGKPAKAGYKMRDSDTVTIDYDESTEPEVPVVELPVLYEDADCIVINKPAGVLTHNKGTRFVEATVASFVRSHTDLMSGERPGIVHRLDRATSGVMIAAKTPEALSWLQKQFHDRKAHKTYSAVIQGVLDPAEAIIDMPIERNPKAPATFRVGINGKEAQTKYTVLRSSQHYSLLELQPRTGRTHQLRVHLAQQKHPIVGDTLYNGQPADRLYLHAHKLEITLPNGTTQTFEAPLPPDFSTILDA